MSKTLYERLGGYDAICAVVNDFLPRLQKDDALSRYWEHRGDDGVSREKQLLIDFLCASAGGPLYYTGRGMKTSHRGMRVSDSDWSALVGQLKANALAPWLSLGYSLGAVVCTVASLAWKRT